MAVYVDALRWHRHGGALVRNYHSAALDRSCHLMADTPAELEAFARRIGLPKRWRHGDHYDLTASRRAKAVQAGAVEITTRAMAARRVAPKGG